MDVEAYPERVRGSELGLDTVGSIRMLARSTSSLAPTSYSDRAGGSIVTGRASAVLRRFSSIVDLIGLIAGHQATQLWAMWTEASFKRHSVRVSISAKYRHRTGRRYILRL